MRIAVSGSHRVGKSTLIELLAERLPHCELVDEPYLLLEEEGYEHSDPPSLEDFEAQLERSLAVLEEVDRDALFDRCPVDPVAYLLTHEDSDSFDVDDWLERIHETTQTLDLIVFVPVEDDDRIAVASHEDRAYRRKVHRRLQRLLVDGALGLETEVLVVEGSPRARVEQVLAHVGARKA
jgi:hypothetical protein